MSDDKQANEPNEDAAKKPRSQDAPLESEVARGNVHSKQHDEPELPTPPPLQH